MSVMFVTISTSNNLASCYKWLLQIYLEQQVLS
jgi:hypothetical protein